MEGLIQFEMERVMKRTIQNPVFCAAVLLAFAAAALANETAKFTFSKPLNQSTKSVKVTFTSNGVSDTTTVSIPANTSATDKRDKVKEALVAKGYTAVPIGDVQLEVRDLTDGTEVKFDPGETGETKDSVLGYCCAATGVAYGNVSTDNPEGYYVPYDPEGNIAVFTGGFVTDLGEYWVELSAEELGFDTTPAYICQRLWEVLEPEAWYYGVAVLNAGESLEFYFDPATTVDQGGVIFGTTSPSAGFRGSVELGGEPSECPEDINGDGLVDLLDLAELLAVYGTCAGDPEFNPAADISQDGCVDLVDLGQLLAAYGIACP